MSKFSYFCFTASAYELPSFLVGCPSPQLFLSAIVSVLLQRSDIDTNGYRLDNADDSTDPLRLKTNPYMVDKHEKIKDEVYERKEIRSVSHCQTCHENSEKTGDFSEKYVEIPGGK